MDDCNNFNIHLMQNEDEYRTNATTNTTTTQHLSSFSSEITQSGMHTTATKHPKGTSMSTYNFCFKLIYVFSSK